MTRPTSFPQQFGKYALIRKIATGGMAEIFQAKQVGAEGFEKDIVIKRILPHFSEDEAFVQMFIDEATITAKLQHNNIVQIYEFDVCAGAYYIAMEYIEGEDLSAVLKDAAAEGRPLSVAQCVWVTMELAKGLHYAHQKDFKGKPLNIIHRDISPHNAMLSYNGDVKLMDFGIAKAAERSTKTQAGTVKGKVAYMSPEQARGKPLDGRSDLFALATVLWEMLTGRRLFLRSSDFETLTAVLKEEVVPPSRHRPGVDQELDDIILTALEKERDHRQKNVEEFNRELTRWYYKNVTDLDAEKLKPTMQRLYAPKLARIRAELGIVDEDPPTIPPARRDPKTPERSPQLRRPAPSEPSRAAATRSRFPSEPARTLEEPVPDALRSPPAARRGAASFTPEPAPTIAPGDLLSPVAPSSSGGGGAASFFSSPETLMEDQGPSQAELQRALADDRARRAAASGQRGGGLPDATLPGSVPAPVVSPKLRRSEREEAASSSKTGLIVLLAFLMLALGGIIAFLVAP